MENIPYIEELPDDICTNNEMFGMKWKNSPSCLDSAFEREAMKVGLVSDPAFPENIPIKDTDK